MPLKASQPQRSPSRILAHGRDQAEDAIGKGEGTEDQRERQHRLGRHEPGQHGDDKRQHTAQHEGPQFFDREQKPGIGLVSCVIFKTLQLLRGSLPGRIGLPFCVRGFTVFIAIGGAGRVSRFVFRFGAVLLRDLLFLEGDLLLLRRPGGADLVAILDRAGEHCAGSSVSSSDRIRRRNSRAPNSGWKPTAAK